MGPKQIIVSLPNLPGKLSTVSELLGENGINIKAMGCGAGELNVVVDDLEKAMLILQGDGYDIEETPVIARICAGSSWRAQCGAQAFEGCECQYRENLSFRGAKRGALPDHPRSR